jgi:ABC-type branched-subunit amino acid transport system substrate-binding protein
VGQAIANAATMAVMDTNAKNLRITTYDTSAGAASAAAKALADGNRLILGPLQAADITAVAATARTARIPVIALASDEAFAARDVFVMGSVPSQSIGRTVAYARQHGMNRFSALVPAGDYGQRASAAFTSAVRAAGGTLVGFETFDRSNTSIASAAQRLRQKGHSDVVLVADGVRLSALAAPAFRPTATTPSARIIGTELWSGESALGATPALRGAWYAAVSDTRFRQFADSYRTRFGALPFRVSTLGYDSVLLTLRIARDWRPGTAFPTARLLDRGGFLGLDGPFRFNANGVVERALEVREVRAGGVNVVSPAPTRFAD